MLGHKFFWFEEEMVGQYGVVDSLAYKWTVMPNRERTGSLAFCKSE